MDNLFDLSSILTDEEAEKLFEENGSGGSDSEEGSEDEERTQEVEQQAEENDKGQSPEKVGEADKDKEKEDAAVSDGDGSSPNVYSTIADALKKDGILSDLTDEDISKIKSADDFANMFNDAVDKRLDERQRRIAQALDDNVPPDLIKQYETAIGNLDSISEDSITEEGEQGDSLRQGLIYRSYLVMGFPEEKARKEAQKSFSAGTEIDDAKDALETLKNAYKKQYDAVLAQAKRQKEEQENASKFQYETLKKAMLEDEVSIGDYKVDKRTAQKAFEAVANPVYKDPKTGNIYSAVMKAQMDDPIEFQKQIGLWYVLTDGGKNLSGVVRKQVASEKNKAIKELERKINTTSLNRDGSLKYASGGLGDTDPLLADGWNVDPDWRQH